MFLVVRKEIARGAEAVLFRDGDLLVKERFRKGYRLPKLDSAIRGRRTAAEGQLIDAARRAGVNVPKIHTVDREGAAIRMDFVDGDKLKDILDSMPEGRLEAVCSEIGRSVALLHNAGIAHGDLTTSNMILRGDDLFFIDFGLASRTKSVEEFAVDLHLFRQALVSAHNPISSKCYGLVIEAYRKHCGKAEAVLKRVSEIEKRGRYKCRE